MQNEEQQLIDNLFTRLKQAEAQSGPRDSAAEKQIQQQIQQQPGAPYYMAQAILIQEAALKQLNARVSQLENDLSQARQPQQNSGGFLSGLFGGGRSPQPAQSTSAPAQPWGNNVAPVTAQQPAYAAAPPAGRGFMGGALQTAVGVAGGVVMAEMLTSMFQHQQPQEIVNIINEPPLPDPDLNNNLDTFNGSDNNAFSGQDNGLPQDDVSDDFSNDAFADNDFDDDNFV
ncbi:DUF2076 domain-containing protein [Erwinia persicina]|uniref:DUF2076 domain-containing protein n=1 Tax=Erwinia persicina TaxID=55211 RepID=UPI00177D75A2|nr:DUF2076 domain-containing protein [Erwinia persicina]MBD8216194.1 DUF2076 domain-containing protein [Erwinia persicina]